MVRLMDPIISKLASSLICSSLPTAPTTAQPFSSILHLSLKHLEKKKKGNRHKTAASPLRLL